MQHIASFSPSSAEKILKGDKTHEIRYSLKKTAPFGVVSSRDLVYIKPVGKEIIGQFKVKKVIFIDAPQTSDLAKIKQEFEDQVLEDTRFWKELESAKYLTIIFISEVSRFISSPISFKKRVLNWVVLDKA